MNLTKFSSSYLTTFDSHGENVMNSCFANDKFYVWDVNRKTPEYRKFEVLAEKIYIGVKHCDEDGATDVLPTFTCNLCNMKIPICYRNEHNNSSIHKVNVKIAKIILTRIQINIESDHEYGDVIEQKSKEFCTLCGVVIRKSEKENHVMSVAHRKSLDYDRFLNDFLKVYVNRDEVYDVDFSYLTKNNHTNFESDQSELLKIERYKTDVNGIENDSVLSNSDLAINGEEKPASKKRRKRPNKNKHSNTDSNDTYTNMEPNCLMSVDKDSKNIQITGNGNHSENIDFLTKIDVSDKQQVYYERKVVTKIHDDHLKKYQTRPNEENIREFLDQTNIETPSKEKRVDNTAFHEKDDIQTNVTKPNKEIEVNPTQNNKAPQEARHEDDVYVKEFLEDIDIKVDQAHLNTAKDYINNTVLEKDKIRNPPHINNEKEVVPIELFNKNIHETTQPQPIKEIGLETTQNIDIEGKSTQNEFITMISEDVQQPSHKLTMVGTDLVQIETVNKNIVQVSFENFNGLYTSRGVSLCKICKITLIETKDCHILSAEHIDRVKVPLEDVHCYRKIDAMYQHCVLCNDYVVNAELHKSMPTHKAALEKALKNTAATPSNQPAETSSNVIAIPSTSSALTLKNKTLINKISIKYCDVCNMNINAKDHETHLKGRLHMMYLSVDSAEQETSRKKPAKHTDVIVEKIYCELCNIFISTDYYDKHIIDKYHVAKADSEKNGENDLNACTLKTYCAPCRQQVHTCTLVDHLKCETHINKVEVLQKNMAAVVQDLGYVNHHVSNAYNSLSNVIFCKICQCEVPSNDGNMIIHVQGKSHRTRYGEFLKMNELKANGSTSYCERCDVTICGAKELEHIESERHAIRIICSATGKSIPLKSGSHCDTCKLYVDDANIGVHVLAHGVKIPKTEDDGKVFCEICNVIVNNKEYEDHAKGKYHRSRSECQTKEHCTLKTYCVPCRVSVHKCTIEDHIKSETHTNNVDKLKNKLLLLVPTKDIEYVNRHIYDAYDEYNHIVFCRVCKSQVPHDDTNIIDHVKGKNHRAKYIELLQNHEISTKQDSLFCARCDTFICDDKELHHIDSERHKYKIVSLDKVDEVATYVCIQCQISVPNTICSRKNHEDELNHKVCDAFYQYASELTNENYHLFYEKTSKKGVSKCRICNTEVFNVDLNAHLLSIYHILRRDTALTDNQISLRDDGAFFCGYCKITLDKMTELHHVNSVAHLTKKTLNKIEQRKDFYCKFCKVSVPNNTNNLLSHHRGIAHKRNLALLETAKEQCLAKSVVRTDEMICKICLLLLPMHMVDDHLLDPMHASKAAELGAKV